MERVWKQWADEEKLRSEFERRKAMADFRLRRRKEGGK
jgi:hypothetical protein